MLLEDVINAKNLSLIEIKDFIGLEVNMLLLNLDL